MQGGDILWTSFLQLSCKRLPGLNPRCKVFIRKTESNQEDSGSPPDG